MIINPRNCITCGTEETPEERERVYKGPSRPRGYYECLTCTTKQIRRCVNCERVHPLKAFPTDQGKPRFHCKECHASSKQIYTNKQPVPKKYLACMCGNYLEWLDTVDINTGSTWHVCLNCGTMMPGLTAWFCGRPAFHRWTRWFPGGDYHEIRTLPGKLGRGHDGMEKKIA